MLECVVMAMRFLVGAEELGEEFAIGFLMEFGEGLVVDFLEVGHGDFQSFLSLELRLVLSPI